MKKNILTVFKTVQAKTIKSMLYLTFLTALVSCKTLDPRAPEAPIPTYKVSIVDQLFCRPANCNPEKDQPCICERKSLCREYEIDNKDQFVLKQNHPQKFCHGTIGVYPREFTSFVKYKNEMGVYIKSILRKCGKKCK